MQKIVIDLFDDFPALIRRLGSDAKYDYFNNTWLNFTGRRLEDELGDGWMDDMHPDDFDRYFETFQKTFGREATFRYRIPADVEAYAVNHGHPEIMKTTDEKKRSLKIDYISEDIQNLIAESLDSADRVKEIVQDLKSFSRLDESEHKVADINAGLGSTINIV
jgi:PAS domain-containing protein